MPIFHISYHRCVNQIAVDYAQNDSSSRRFLAALKPDVFLDILRQLECLYDDWTYDIHEQRDSVDSSFLQVAEDAEFYFSPNTEDGQVLDEDTIHILNEIYERLQSLRHRGISTRTIRQYLISHQQLSRLVITSDFRIFLPDYDNLEVKLTPLPKALYLLFLRHPEGIVFKQIAEHCDELSQIYAQLTPTINPQRRQKHIDALLDPLNNSLNEKVSIIHRAFARILDSSLLHFYVISGDKGSPRFIKLDKTLIFC